MNENRDIILLVFTLATSLLELILQFVSNIRSSTCAGHRCCAINSSERIEIKVIKQGTNVNIIPNKKNIKLLEEDS